MSGHSKWSTIKHKKAAKDAKRGKIFTKLIKEITVSARLGGADPASNPRLRTAVAAAKAQSMPNDNIDRAIKKGVGGLDGDTYQEVTYEGYGPGGMAVILEGLTDNRNRTVADVRSLFSKHGGNLGESGSVRWMFDRVGQILVDGKGTTEEAVFEAALEAGASDVAADGEGYLVTTPFETLEDTRGKLEACGFTLVEAEITFVPQNTVRLEGADASKALRLLDALEDHDDVQRVSANFDIDDEELSRLSA
jgi:YebC/PmpR family DNA-binding regulatory protein